MSPTCSISLFIRTKSIHETRKNFLEKENISSMQAKKAIIYLNQRWIKMLFPPFGNSPVTPLSSKVWTTNRETYLKMEPPFLMLCLSTRHKTLQHVCRGHWGCLGQICTAMMPLLPLTKPLFLQRPDEVTGWMESDLSRKKLPLTILHCPCLSLITSNGWHSFSRSWCTSQTTHCAN